MFHPLLIPIFMQNLGKILRAVSEIIHSAWTHAQTDARMHGQKGNFISPFGFQPGTNKNNTNNKNNKRWQSGPR